MFALWGTRKEYTGDMDHDSYVGVDEIVALFTTREKAQAYIVASTLKSPNRGGKYLNRSLLSIYSSAWVDEHEEAELLIDPEL